MKATLTAVAASRSLLVGALAAPMRAEIIEQVLVKVNGDIFTKTELEQRQIAALRAAEPADRPEDAERTTSS